MLAAQARMRIALLVVMLGGCSLYWGGGGGGGGDGGMCNYGLDDQQPSFQLRDPYTGQCETFGGGTCSDPCGPCATGIAVPDWASCSSQCLGRIEADCEATAGCQTEMLDTSYWGCFPIEPGELAPPNLDCTTLDDYGCTQNDACIAVYTYASTTDKTSTKFLKCVNEATPPPPPACTTLTTESDCLARSDCDAVYNGYDCTCDPSGCVCKTETFASCEAR